MTRPRRPQRACGMLQAIAATITGDWAAGGRLATEAVSTLGGASATDPLGRFGWNLVARDVALSECWDDATAAARVGAPPAGPGPGATARLRRNPRPG